MTRRTTLVLVVTLLAIGAFAAAAFLFQRQERQQAGQQAAAHQDVMVRAHSPVLGPEDAPVTIVEFFDPACEACRAFYPHVKKTLAAYPRDVRLVLRYVPFHQEPSVVGVQILEAARKQGKFEAVLEALLNDQPVWASHDSPAPARAWEAATAAGLDIAQARAFVATGEADRMLQQDMTDLQQIGIRSTPTFFVNGKPLQQPSPQALHDMVSAEVEAAKRRQ